MSSRIGNLGNYSLKLGRARNSDEFRAGNTGVTSHNHEEKYGIVTIEVGQVPCDVHCTRRPCPECSRVRLRKLSRRGRPSGGQT